jgi:hypothetical protein
LELLLDPASVEIFCALPYQLFEEVTFSSNPSDLELLLDPAAVTIVCELPNQPLEVATFSTTPPDLELLLDPALPTEAVPLLFDLLPLSPLTPCALLYHPLASNTSELSSGKVLYFELLLELMTLSLVVCPLPDQPLEITTFSKSTPSDLALLLEPFEKLPLLTNSLLELFAEEAILLPFELVTNPSLKLFEELPFWTKLFDSKLAVLVYPSPIQSIAEEDTLSSLSVQFMVSGEYV